MTKKWAYRDRYPGLRPLRGLTRGYHLPPFQGLGFETDVFYSAKLCRIFRESGYFAS
jgi:hypothetical protein